MHNNVLYADRAKPAVKIEVEVIVFEDGNVTVQGMPVKKISPAKNEEKAKVEDDNFVNQTNEVQSKLEDS
mgnify:CR=1 FL=1